MDDEQANPDSIRPEWLFEIANQLQPLIAPSTAPSPSIADVLGNCLPQSALERKVANELVARLDAARRSIDAGSEMSTSTAKVKPWHDASDQRIRSAVAFARGLLQREPQKHWTVDALARRAGCNRTHLEKGFRDHCSRTVHQELVLWRVETAKMLLRTTAWRTEEVAKAVGYRSKVSLYQQFRRVLSMTPEQYRRRWTHEAPSEPCRVRFSHLIC